MSEHRSPPAVPPIGRPLNMVEAAERLGVSRRKFQDLVAAYPFYSLNGNRKLFSEDDLAKLWDAMRVPVRKAHPFFDFNRGPSAPPIIHDVDPYANLRTRKSRKPLPASRKPRAE